MNRILRFALFSLVWMCSSAATATVIKTFDVRADYPIFTVIYPQQALGLSLDWLDTPRPALKHNLLAQFRNRWPKLRPPVPITGPGSKPPSAVAEPAVLELMALGFSVLVLLRIRMSRINDAGQNLAS